MGKIDIGTPSAQVGPNKFYTVQDLVKVSGQSYPTIIARAKAKGIDRQVVGKRIFSKPEAESIVNDVRGRGRPVGTTGAYGPHKATIAKKLAEQDAMVTSWPEAINQGEVQAIW